jgi:hypothetical protein
MQKLRNGSSAGFVGGFGFRQRAMAESVLDRAEGAEAAVASKNGIPRHPSRRGSVATPTEWRLSFFPLLDINS